MISMTTKARIAAAKPKYPINLASFSSFWVNGEGSWTISFEYTAAFITPAFVWSPTAMIRSRPEPLETVVPEKIGSEMFFVISLVSPVRADSSTCFCLD